MPFWHIYLFCEKSKRHMSITFLFHKCTKIAGWWLATEATQQKLYGKIFKDSKDHSILIKEYINRKMVKTEILDNFSIKQWNKTARKHFWLKQIRVGYNSCTGIAYIYTVITNIAVYLL